MTKLKVFGCKELSVLSDYRRSPKDQETVLKKLNEGEVVSIDTSKTYWSMDDKQYYKLDLGYGNVGYVNTNGFKVVN